MRKNNNIIGCTLNHFSSIKRTAISVGVLTALSMSNAVANTGAVWVESIRGGETRFYDWGYSGPQGQNAGQWDSNGTFDGAAQIQHVVTTEADRLTPDASYTINTDLSQSGYPKFYDANMDTQVNFYDWGYTTTAGSTFSNMQIDADGDYLIKREDMAFNYYNSFDYQDDGTGDLSSRILALPEGNTPTNLGFQPYALSDATGWCGSITASNPAALEAMAGQVTFDFGFEVFQPVQDKDENGIGIPGRGGMQIITDFQMRSYGSMEVHVTSAAGGAGDITYNADAVVNNTNPLASTGSGNMIEVPVLNMDGTAALDENGVARTMMVEEKTVGAGGVDENYYNKVSFMGGGAIPDGVWVKVVDPNARMSNDNIVEVLGGALADGSPSPADGNVIWHQNGFAGYPFLLRADGVRVLDAMDFSLYSDQSGVPLAGYDAAGSLINLEGTIVQDLSAVPVPAAVWLFGSGLLGLIGMSRRKKTEFR